MSTEHILASLPLTQELVERACDVADRYREAMARKTNDVAAVVEALERLITAFYRMDELAEKDVKGEAP